MIFEFLAAYAGIIFFLGGLMFTPPALYAWYYNRLEKTSIPYGTTIPFAILLWFFALTWASMAMTIPGHLFYLPVITNALGASIWTALVIQRVMMK